MEDFIRNNFDVINKEDNEGNSEEYFQYKASNGYIRITKLNFFLNNTDKFEELINYWQEEGYDVPDY